MRDRQKENNGRERERVRKGETVGSRRKVTRGEWGGKKRDRKRGIDTRDGVNV